MTDVRRDQLAAKMLVCSYIVRGLLDKIRTLEANTDVPFAEKISEIKKIKEEMTKVGTEIDSIKKEITLLKSYSVN
jgi:type I restriction-modification system DNA methylase subunit